MRNSILLLAAASALIFAGACQKEEAVQPVEGTAEVTFTLGQQGISTRAYSDGKTATKLSYAVYEAGKDEAIESVTRGVTFTNLNATVKIRLAKGKSYDFIFWADAEGAPYTFDAAKKTVTVDYLSAKANDESMDAFFAAKKNLAVDGDITQTVTLKRPFAQVNIGAFDAIKKYLGFDPAKSQFVTKAYKTLNLYDGTVADKADVTFAFADMPAESEVFPVEGVDVDYLSMNYILVAADKATQALSIQVSDATDANNSPVVSIDNVPVQRNYRTNIYGNLFTSSVDFTMVINPEYEGNDNVDNPDLGDPQHVESVSLDKTEALLAIGKTVTLSTTISPDNATDKTVSWTSSDESVATVANGVVTAVAPGNATITVTTTDGGQTATCAITVRPKMPIEYVAEYNIGATAGTFATSQANDASGYYTWAEANTTGTVPDGYHVPTNTELWAIAPDASANTKFNENVSTSDYSEKILVHGSTNTYTADYSGDSTDSVIYGLRFKSSDNKFLSAYRYEYISDGNNTRMEIIVRYLGPSFTGDISTIANESYWSSNNSEDVKRVFPAAGYYNESNNLVYKNNRGYFWAENEKGSKAPEKAFCLYFKPELALVSYYSKVWKESVRPFSNN